MTEMETYKEVIELFDFIKTICGINLIKTPIQFRPGRWETGVIEKKRNWAYALKALSLSWEPNTKKRQSKHWSVVVKLDDIFKYPGMEKKRTTTKPPKYLEYFLKMIVVISEHSEEIKNRRAM